MLTGPLVKICGITSVADAYMAAELGADLLGFIFHPKSPRCTTPELPASLDLPGLLKVGVFVDQDLDEVLRIVDRGGLDLIQLHGGQDEAFCSSLGSSRVIKVVWPERAASQLEFQIELDRFAPACRLFLADAGAGGGGHGRGMAPHAEALLAEALFPRPWFLAGGLAPENVGAAFERLKPQGLDFNSGVESAPGIKDENRLRQAFDALHEAKRKGDE